MEEALIFETGRLDATGVDIDEPSPFASRLGACMRAGARLACPAFSEPGGDLRATTCACRARTGLRSTPDLYPLGSCTMKHNPRLNEKMARLPGFADIHRALQPVSTVQGALGLIDDAGRAR